MTTRTAEPAAGLPPAQPDATGPVPVATSPVDATGKRRPLALGLLVQARPRQWVKNVLLLGAPGAAGVLFHPDALLRVLIAVVAFCLVSSGTYYLNDAVDVEADRRHATKRHRPMASGWVPLPVGFAVGALLLAGGLAIAALVDWRLLVAAAVYVTTTTAYSFYLKRIAVVELAAVAAGFVIRAIAGGLAADVPISEWFLLVACFGSLFMVAGKRHGEYLHIGEQASTRASLREYTLPYLRFAWTLAASAATITYCLWAFEIGQAATRPIFSQLSVLPFVLALLRYALLLDRGEGGAPEDVVLKDRTLLVLGLVWVGVFAGGVYIGR